MADKKRVTLGVTGSIAAYRSADIIRRLQDQNFDVSVVMTPSAEKFITPLTLSSLAGEDVNRDWSVEDDRQSSMAHIHLAKVSDVVLVAPATAQTIAKFAHGFAEDLLSCLLLATSAPIVMAPAMNTEMYQHPFVQANCAKLKEAHVRFVEPIEGQLACGDVGSGHIADTQDIVQAVIDARKV